MFGLVSQPESFPSWSWAVTEWGIFGCCLKGNKIIFLFPKEPELLQGPDGAGTFALLEGFPISAPFQARE